MSALEELLQSSQKGIKPDYNKLNDRARVESLAKAAQEASVKFDMTFDDAYTNLELNTPFDPSEPPNPDDARGGDVVREFYDMYRVVALSPVVAAKKALGVAGAAFAPLTRLEKLIVGISGTKDTIKLWSEIQNRVSDYAAYRYYVNKRTKELEDAPAAYIPIDGLLGMVAQAQRPERDTEARKQAEAELKEIVDIESPLDVPGPLEMVGNRVKSLKALIPWKGAADDMPTLAGAITKEYYENVADQPAPWWYEPVVGAAMDTIIFAGPGVLASGRSLKNTRLTAQEIDSLSKIYSKKAIGKMSVEEARAKLFAFQRKAQEFDIQRQLDKQLNKTEAVKKLTRLIREAEFIPGEARSQERAKRINDAVEVLAKGQGRQAFLKARKKLGGELPITGFEPPMNNMSQLEMDQLWDMANAYVQNAPSDGKYVMANLGDALDGVLHGKVLNKGQIKILENVYGTELSNAMASKAPATQKFWSVMGDLASAPTTLTAAYDASYLMRQGIMALPGNPKEWTKAAVKTFFAARPGAKGVARSKYMDDIIRNDQYYPIINGHGLFLPQMNSLYMTKRDELYASKIAERLPGVKWSERTYLTFMNELRYSIARKHVKAWQGTNKTARDYDNLMKYINHLTGRGDLPSDEWGPALNAIFYSPRFQVSRAQLGFDLAKSAVNKKDRAILKIAAKDLGAYYGSGITLLALADYAGLDVDYDPRSSDFGKIRYENTTYDVWAGNAQLARFVAQVAARKAKSPLTDEVYDKEIQDTIVRFFQSKLSPAAGFTMDWLTGRTISGDLMRNDHDFVAEQLWNRLGPLFAQDVADALTYQGLDWSTPFSVGGAFVGVGVNTYEPSASTMARVETERFAKETYGKGFRDLDPIEQDILRRLIQIDRPDILQMERQADYELGVTSFDIQEEMERSRHKLFKSLPKETRETLDEHTVDIGGVGSTIGQFVLNKERQKRYSELLKEEIDKAVTQTKDSSRFDSMDIKERQMMLDYAIENARQIASNKLLMESYVDDKP